MIDSTNVRSLRCYSDLFCFEENNSLEVQKTLNCPGLSPEVGVDWPAPLHPRTSGGKISNLKEFIRVLKHD